MFWKKKKTYRQLQREHSQLERKRAEEEKYKKLKGKIRQAKYGKYVSGLKNVGRGVAKAASRVEVKGPGTRHKKRRMINPITGRME